jgi:PKHD-type hydroxylase
MNTHYNFPLDTSTNPTEYYWFEKGFNNQEIDNIVKLSTSLPSGHGTIAGGGTADEISGIRKSFIRWIPQSPEYMWIYDRIAQLVTEANSIWKFDISSMPEAIQYTEYYDDGGHYDWHLDIGPDELSYRKISVTIQLSETEDYEGGDLEILRGGTSEKTVRGKGAAVLFPSFILHRVTPVTRGTRKSFVLWLGGGHYK